MRKHLNYITLSCLTVIVLVILSCESQSLRIGIQASEKIKGKWKIDKAVFYPKGYNLAPVELKVIEGGYMEFNVWHNGESEFLYALGSPDTVQATYVMNDDKPFFNPAKNANEIDLAVQLNGDGQFIQKWPDELIIHTSAAVIESKFPGIQAWNAVIYLSRPDSPRPLYYTSIE